MDKNMANANKDAEKTRNVCFRQVEGIIKTEQPHCKSCTSCHANKTVVTVFIGANLITLCSECAEKLKEVLCNL